MHHRCPLVTPTGHQPVEVLRDGELREDVDVIASYPSFTPHDVRDFLGHANITTTSCYLQSSSERLADALRRLEVATSEKFAHRSHKPTDQAARTSVSDQKRPILQG